MLRPYVLRTKEASSVGSPKHGKQRPMRQKAKDWETPTPSTLGASAMTALGGGEVTK
jgi:hypothetical protein